MTPAYTYAILALSLIMMAGCASDNNALKDYEKQKLDPVLQQLIKNPEEAPTNALNVNRNAEGHSRYDVILYGSDADSLRKAGIPIQSVIDTIMTAQLTIEQIRKAASLSSVRSVRHAKKSYPNN